MAGSVTLSHSTVGKFSIDASYNVVRDTVLIDVPFFEKFWTYIDANASGSKLLLVQSKYADVSSGALYEYDLTNGQLALLLDQNRNVSSARYLPGDEGKILYYSYGDSNLNGAGYLLYEKSTQHDSLLFPYLSSAGPSEMLNGFDIHPQGDKILVPISMSTRTDWKSPKLGIISITNQRIDTLNISFDFSRARTGLWIRYNRDASKILYCCFPHGSYTETTNDNSEVGIIESSTLVKKVLDVNTNGESSYGSVQLAPNWNPQENAILFGSGHLSFEGGVGRRHLYILTQLN